MMNISLFVGTLVFGLGVLGFLTRRNLILMFLSLELMLFGVSLNFITFGHHHGDLGGQTFVILILTVAACEAALALALIVTLYRSKGTLDVNVWQALGVNPSTVKQATVNQIRPVDDVDHESEDGDGDYPKLTPAGQDPLRYPTHIDPQRNEPVGMA